MKNIKTIVGSGLMVLAFGTLHASVDCNRDFMKDPCAKDAYSVVESERYVRGPHNCMAIAHFFPGEEPAGYCGGHKGKNTAHPRTPVVSVD